MKIRRTTEKPHETAASELILEGNRLCAHGRLDEAVSLYTEALRLLLSDDVEPSFEPIYLAGAAYTGLGMVARSKGDLDQASEYFQHAHAATQSVAPESRAQAVAINNIGLIHDLKGDLETALEWYERALEIDQALDRSEGAPSLATARDLHNVAKVFADLGFLKRASDHSRKGRSIVKKLAPDSAEMASTLRQLGLIRGHMGDLKRALSVYEKARKIDMDLSQPEPLAHDLVHIGAILYLQGKISEAVDRYREALTIAESIAPSSKLTASIRRKLGVIERDRGNLDEALDHFQAALAIDSAFSPESGETADDLNDIALLVDARGDSKSAVGFLRDAVGIYQRSLPLSSGYATCLTNLGLLHMEREELHHAIECFEQAVETAESLRTRAGEQRAREHVFAGHQSPYEALIACLFMRGLPGDAELAFGLTEKSRARTLSEMLADRDIEVERGNAEVTRLVAKERALRIQLTKAENRLANARRDAATSSQDVAQIEQEHRELGASLDRVLGELPASYAELRHEQPLDLAAAEEQLAPDTLLLQYAMSADAAFVFAVRSDDSAMIPLGATVPELESLSERAIGSYRRGEYAAEGSSGALADLGRALIGDIPDQFFSGVKSIVVSPHGSLSYLPFEILPLPDGELLGDRYVTCYAPSMTVLAALRARAERNGIASATGDFVGFGDPTFENDGDAVDEGTLLRRFLPTGGSLTPLPGTRAEIERIARLVGNSSAFFGPDATEFNVKTGVASHRFVHFATHGLLDDRDPLYSGLALAPPTQTERIQAEDLDEFLQVYEMFALPLKGCEVVVCSACQTGLGQIQAGEGLVGFSRALLFAGARCVVLSLWPVPDLQSARLMKRFYEYLQEGSGPAEALHLAKLSVRRSHPEVYADPFTWAAFVAVGLG